MNHETANVIDSVKQPYLFELADMAIGGGFAGSLRSLRDRREPLSNKGGRESSGHWRRGGWQNFHVGRACQSAIGGLYPATTIATTIATATVHPETDR